MNLQSIIVLAIIAVWVILAVRHTKRKGIGSCGDSCGGDCAHCGGCSRCEAKPDDGK